MFSQITLAKTFKILEINRVEMILLQSKGMLSHLLLCDAMHEML